MIKNFTSLKKNIILSLILCIVGCADSSNSWKIDSQYSSYLTIDSDEYFAKYKSNIADTVDEIIIYETDAGDHFLSLSDLEKNSIAYKTSEKEKITELLSAVYKNENIPSGCFKARTKKAFHVIARDIDLSRIGYFIVSGCMIDNEKKSMITFLYKDGESGIFYSKELENILISRGVRL